MIRVALLPAGLTRSRCRSPIHLVGGISAERINDSGRVCPRGGERTQKNAPRLLQLANLDQVPAPDANFLPWG